MRLLTYKGKRIGECGKKTPLTDTYGKALYSGDLVEIAVTKDSGEEILQNGYEFVCYNSFKDVWRNPPEYFIMGIGTEHFASWVKDEISIYQNHPKWKIKKVKDWKNINIGEKYSGVVLEEV